MESCKDKHHVSFTCVCYLIMMLPMAFAIKSEFRRATGHYPGAFCEFTNAWLDTKAGTFFYESDTDLHKDQWCSDVWDIQHSRKRPEKCDKTYPNGFTFTIFYWGNSNYFHMHVDVLIPMYQALYYNSHPSNPLLMPVVESSRMQRMTWDTKAFLNESKWWMELLEVLTGDHTLLPLDKKVQDSRQTICFDNLYTGTPSYNKYDAAFYKSLIKYVKKFYGITERIPEKHRLAIITRKNRRKLLNEKEMVKAVKDLVGTDLVDFEGMTFKQQIERMQFYDILVGVNGAGFMNALYLPSNGVAIQLAPYNTTLNVEEFATLVKNRGPYLEWHNTHEENHKLPKYPSAHNVDTIVDPKEFRELIQKALAILDKKSKPKREL